MKSTLTSFKYSVDYLTLENSEEAETIIRALPPRTVPPSFESLLASLASVARDTNIPQTVVSNVEQTFSRFCRTLAFPPSAVPISALQWNLIATAVVVALGHKRLLGGILNENSADMQVGVLPYLGMEYHVRACLVALFTNEWK